MYLDEKTVLTMEPTMLLSIVNMKLRNDFSDIQALCCSLDVSQSSLNKQLQRIGYHYQPILNQYRFIPV